MEVIGKILNTLRFRELMDYSFWDFVINVAIFGALAVPMFLLFWVFYEEKLKSRRIQILRSNSKKRLGREIRNSVLTLFIFTAVDSLVYLAQLNGYTRIYRDVSEYGWAYLAFSALAMIVLHDTFYYFIHRFMHLPGIYQHVHKVHHESTDPNPLATFSMHPLEAVLEVSIYVIFAFLMPVHLIALWTWQVIQIILSVIAHLGYEIYPANFTRHWLFKFKTPSTHHNMHHSKFNGNYSLYFTWWDKLFKTEFSDYYQTYDSIHGRIHSAAAKSINTSSSNSILPHNNSSEPIAA
jgi:Delta7-sterol 5-desaturase